MRPWTQVRSDLATQCRSGADQETVADLRRELRASRAADYLTRLVDAAPPLTPAQIDQLQAILSTAGEPDLDATGLPDCGEQ